MVIKTRGFTLRKGKIKLTFVSGKEVTERSFEVKLQGAINRNPPALFYEVEDQFPKELIKLFFGVDAVVLK